MKLRYPIYSISLYYRGFIVRGSSFFFCRKLFIDVYVFYFLKLEVTLF